MKSSLSIFAFLLFVNLAPSAQAAPLHLCFEDTDQQPWTYPNRTGLNFDLLKRVTAATGEQFEFTPLPWKRCIAYVASGEMDGVLGAAYSAERTQFAVYPSDANGSERKAAAMYADNFNIFVRKDSNITWDGRAFSNLKGSVAAQAGFVVVAQLQQLGVNVNERSKSAENGLRLILMGEVDAAVLQGIQAMQLQRKDPRFRDELKMLPLPFASLPLHLMISKVTYKKNPKRIAAIWQALEKEHSSSEYQAHEKDVIANLQ